MIERCLNSFLNITDKIGLRPHRLCQTSNRTIYVCVCESQRKNLFLSVFLRLLSLSRGLVRMFFSPDSGAFALPKQKEVTRHIIDLIHKWRIFVTAKLHHLHCVSVCACSFFKRSYRRLATHIRCSCLAQYCFHWKRSCDYNPEDFGRHSRLIGSASFLCSLASGLFACLRSVTKPWITTMHYDKSPSGEQCCCRRRRCRHCHQNY